MKHIHFLLFSMLLLTLPACREEVELNKGEQPLEITLSSDTVILLQREGATQALSIDWTSGSNHGAGSAISYQVWIDQAGNEFAEGIKWVFPRTTSRTLTFSHAQWQDTLLTYFPTLPLEKYTTLEVCVRATVEMTGEEQVSAVKTLTVCPYKTRVENLYMVGDATPNGWDAQLATRLTPHPDSIGVFTYEGVLSRGEFKFLLTPGIWLPCYVRDEQDSTQMILREKEDEYPDFKWEISHKSNYRLVINTNELTLTMIDLGGDFVEPVYDHVYMIGDATIGGWSWDNVTEMSVDGTDFNCFVYEGTLFQGEIKFPIEIKHDWSGLFLMAPQADCPPSENGTYLVQNQPDYKWVIPTTGTWRIVIHADLQTISFTLID